MYYLHQSQKLYFSSLIEPLKKVLINKELNQNACNNYFNFNYDALNNQIENISAIVRGCALCEASAGLTVKLFKKNDVM